MSLFPLLLAAFAALGVAAGAWQVLIADLARALALTPGPLGLALTLAAVAAIPVMHLGGRFADRYGVRPAIATGALVIGGAFFLHVLASSWLTAIAAFLVWGMGAGLYDVGINAAASRHELASGERRMAWLHAAFSGAAATGALATGVALAQGVPFRSAYLAVTLGMVGIAALIALSPAMPPPPPAEERRAADGRGSLYRDAAVLAIASMTFAGYYGESAMENWSALYLREGLGVTAFVGASGVAVFHAAMTTGRIMAGTALRLVGPRTWMAIAGTLGAVGTLLAVGTSTPAVAIGGFLLVGLALSAVAPLSFSLAAAAAPDRVGQATAVVTTIGYSGALFAPGIVGGLAELVGLRVAIGTVAVAAVCVVVLSMRVREA